MSLDENVHTDRARAESFGAVAAQYDHYRPSYPGALITDLAELTPGRTLDVACGTGKVAVALVACGMSVLGVEVDPHMAEVARGHGIIVEVAPFETWDDRDRTFDLITCGQGWHWIDPELGAAKAARLLSPDGTLALFWNYTELEADLQQALDDVYGRYAPELAAVHNSSSGHNTNADVAHIDALVASGGFATVDTRRYRWHATLSADEWIGRLGTHSDHIQLPDEQRAALLDAVRAVVESHGDAVASHSGTYAIFART